MIWKFTCFLFKHHVKDGVGTFIAIRHNQCPPKTGIRPSKNRFDQIFWLAQARTLFEALRRIASLVCILTISSLYFFFCVKQKKRSCSMIDIFIKRLQKMCNKLKSHHQTGSKFKFTLVYKYFNFWRAGPYIGTQIQLELDILLQQSETEFTSILQKFNIRALQSSAWKTWWASLTEITGKSWHGHSCIILKTFPCKSWNSYYISDPISALSITEFVSFLPQIIP